MLLKGRPDRSIMEEQVPTSYAQAKEVFSDLAMGCDCCSIVPPSIMSAMFDDKNWVVDNQAVFCLIVR